jgi:mono/diheme cytochrome c family protein
MDSPRLFLAFFLFSILPASAQAAVDFQREVRPILSDKCFACHGPDEHDRKADLRLDTFDGSTMDLGGYQAVVPGQPEKSVLLERLVTKDEDEIMPPPKSGKVLSEKEIAVLRTWIQEGAVYETHWSFAPLTRPEPPAQEQPGFTRNSIDHFVMAKLKEKGLAPAPEADPVTLVRRLHLDLTGLPPTGAETKAFLADQSAQAYEKMVDDLLARPSYAERMAMFWLDLVRYADTIGYHSDNAREVSPYRDYVIHAFQDNLPFDQFATEQLAGDLLPGATDSQRVASGYNMLLQTTEEGGAQDKEYRAIYATDRVRNFGEVFLGLTTGCAQCHDHKFDPITARDFYRLAAFFADIEEPGVGKRAPNFSMPTPEQNAAIAEWEKKIAEQEPAALLSKDAVLAATVAKEQSEWESKWHTILQGGGESWPVTKPISVSALSGTTFEDLGDGSYLAKGENPPKDTYVVEIPAVPGTSALRLETLTHDSLANKSLSRANGNFVLTGWELFLVPEAGGEGTKLAISKAEADFEQPAFPVANVLDNNPASGWAVNGHGEAKNRQAMFLLAAPLVAKPGERLRILMKHESAHAQHQIGRFRLSLSSIPSPVLPGKVDLPAPIADVLRKKEGERQEAERKLLTEHFWGIAPALQPSRANREAWLKEIATIKASILGTQVVKTMAQPRETRILARGDWQDDSGEVVKPGVPTFLAFDPEPEGRMNRLDLAKWVVDKRNPLTARTFVNRVWSLFLGNGLSKSLIDLGGQGAAPGNPELLDWLAVEFRDNGWNVKALVKTIVMSGVYRQTSLVSPEARQHDPSNEWLARQGMWRLPAEFVRDSALSTAGLLVKNAGGPSVKPYQPAGYWAQLNFPKREWQNDTGDGLYRRGLYTFWCRSFPHPAMVAFDAPSREECTAERPRSNIPQQALVLLNETGFVEAARGFARRILSEGGGDDEAKLLWAWREALSREPMPGELEVLRKTLQEERARYQADEAAAKAYLSIGATPVREGEALVDLAAWSQVARIILNLYETTSRY